MPRRGNHVTRLIRLINGKYALIRLYNNITTITKRRSNMLYINYFDQRVVRLRRTREEVFHGFFQNVRLPYSLCTPIMIFSRGIRTFNNVLNDHMTCVTLGKHVVMLHTTLSPFITMNVMTKTFSTKILPRLFRNHLYYSIQLTMLYDGYQGQCTH